MGYLLSCLVRGQAETNRNRLYYTKTGFGMVEVLRKEVAYSFDETVERVEKACESEGFSILLTRSIDSIFKQTLGIDYTGYSIILACAPELAKKALDASKDVGTIFPCSFVVYEDDNKVMVAHASIMRIAADVGLATKESMEPIINETGKRIRKVWEKI
jgi:uncharacterized protein (DUF302 family)